MNFDIIDCSCVNQASSVKNDFSLIALLKSKAVQAQHAVIDPWLTTLRDVRDVRDVRQQMQFGGYPFHRIQLNQIGDGLVTAAASGILIAAAGVNPILAGVFTWGIRVCELMVASVWNQRMASDRREARIAATQVGQERQDFSPGQSKMKACREILSSIKYDALGAVAAISASVVLLAGGPLSSVILLGGVIALSQTMSKFKEMAWSSLRYVVNSSEELRAKQVDLQEPMSAYEMMITVGILTASYAVGFGAIAVLFAYAAPVALPVAIVVSAVGAGLMVCTKRRFKKELNEGLLEHDQFMRHKFTTAATSSPQEGSANT